MAFATTATLVALLMPQASADGGSADINATGAPSASASTSVEFNRASLMERYVDQPAPGGSGSQGGPEKHDSSDAKKSGGKKQDKPHGAVKDGDSGDDKKSQDSGKKAKQNDAGKQSGNSSSKEDSGGDELGKPLKKLDRTSPFGPRASPITGAAGGFHSGQDYGGACGTAVKSSQDGKIVDAGWHPYGGGNRITVSHGDGMKTSYNHLSSIRVSVGDTVDEGDRIGEIGSTGASTGCHLHFEVIKGGDKVDPLKFL